MSNKNNNIDDKLMHASLLSTSFHTLHMSFLLLLCFLDNPQVLRRKVNFNFHLIGLHTSDAIIDPNTCHSLQATVSMANSKGKPSHILPFEDNKQSVGLLHIQV